MFKLKFYLLNALVSSLIGLAVWAVYLFTWGCFHSFQQLIFEVAQQIGHVVFNAFFSMAVGAIIGTLSMLFCSQFFLRLSHMPWMGFFTNFLAVAILNIVGSILTGVRSFQLFIDSTWSTALVVSEILSFFVTFSWYRSITAYKNKLEEKKASLKS